MADIERILHLDIDDGHSHATSNFGGSMLDAGDFVETPNGNVVQVVEIKPGAVVVYADDSQGFLALDDLRPTRTAVNTILSGSYDLEGVAAWWRRPRSALDGLTPDEVWSSDPERVLELARRLDGAGSFY